MTVFRLSSPVGPLRGATTSDGLALLSFAGSAFSEPLERLAAGAPIRTVRRHRAATELQSYFAGDLKRFSVDVDLRLAKGFTRRVLERLLRDVPFGQRVTYGELAALSGNPRAARAVGNAVGANPVAIVVP